MRFTLGQILLIAVSAISPATAFAYIDPGTGSVLIQGIIAAIAAVGVTLKLYWHRVIGFFRRKAAKDPGAAGTVEPGADREEQI